MGPAWSAGCCCLPWLLLLTCTVVCRLALGITDSPTTIATGPPMSLVGYPGVVSVEEGQRNHEQLATMRCQRDGLDSSRAFLSSLTPSSPCGSCFSVMPCDAITKTKFCLYYQKGQGRLSYRGTPSYLATVLCTDDVSQVAGTMEIRVQDNLPPVFVRPAKLLDDMEIRGTTFKGPGSELYNVIASDVEGDAILYSMTQDPDYDLLEIGHADGKIRAKKDMNLLCEDEIRSTVSIKDIYNDVERPAIITLIFKGGNERPAFANKETLVQINEHADHEEAKTNRQILKLNVPDATLFNKRRFKMKAEPLRGLEYYSLDNVGGGWYVRPRTRLDYEYEPLRSVKLIFEVTDGFCEAEPYSVTIELKDVNELPAIVPSHVERTVYEGTIDIDPGWVAIDPDLPHDTLVWSMVSDGGGAFDVDPSNGRIISRGEFDVDPNEREKVRVLEVRVVDRNGERAKATMKLTIIDKNDNVPEFLNRLVRVTATECTRVGTQLHKVNAKDADSLRDGNNDFVFSGDGANITVLATGHIVLKQKCTAGQKESIAASITDQGTYPGPLQGVPTTIAFSCNVCPDPPPDSTNDPNSGANFERERIRYWLKFRMNDYPNDAGDLSGLNEGLGALLSWLIPALILATLSLAMMAYVLWRACYVIIPRCRRLALKRKYRPKKKKEVKRNVVPLEEKKVEDQVEVIKLNPPEPPPPEPDPRFFGFWKETYVDRDQRHFPERDTLPINVANDRIIQEREALEEEEEKQERIREREKKKEAFRMEVEEYKEQLSHLQNPRPLPPPAPPKKTLPCSVL